MLKSDLRTVFSVRRRPGREARSRPLRITVRRCRCARTLCAGTSSHGARCVRPARGGVAQHLVFGAAMLNSCVEGERPELSPAGRSMAAFYAVAFHVVALTSTD